LVNSYRHLPFDSKVDNFPSDSILALSHSLNLIFSLALGFAGHPIWSIYHKIAFSLFAAIKAISLFQIIFLIIELFFHFFNSCTANSIIYSFTPVFIIPFPFRPHSHNLNYRGWIRNRDFNFLPVCFIFFILKCPLTTSLSYFIFIITKLLHYFIITKPFFPQAFLTAYANCILVLANHFPFQNVIIVTYINYSTLLQRGFCNFSIDHPIYSTNFNYF